MCLAPHNKYTLITALVAATLLLQSCASNDVDRASHFHLEPLISAEDRAEYAQARETLDPETLGTEPESRATLAADPGPRAPRSGDAMGLAGESVTGEELEGEPIRLDVNNLPLPVFINEVFGEKLGLSYSLAPSLAGQSDLVTLRLSEPLEPSALFRTARSVLADYGVAISKQENVWTFSQSDDVSTESTPLLVTGSALPDVPASHRPVFQVIELSVVSNSQVRGVVQGLFRGKTLQITEDPMRNAIMLRGSAAEVADAADAVRFFDRPILKGRNSVLLRPAYREIPALADALSTLLAAQGYSVGRAGGTTGAVILLPMPELEVIVALANDTETLEHISRWATRLDQDYQKEIDTGTFLYEVQNTSAANLASLISQLYGGSGDGSGQSAGQGGSQSQSGGQGSGQSNQSGSSSGTDGRRSSSGRGASSTEVANGRLVVDDRRNVLIFRGSGRDWMELRSIIQDLDKQVPSVLMEVLLAEVTLNDTQGVGVEWLARAGVDDMDGVLRTLGGLGVGSRGFSYTLNSAGQTRAVINAFYDSNRAVIRSSPKIMVKSGEVARIEVGNEIPVLTSTRRGEFQSGGDSEVLQQFQFRKTGVNLVVEPVVQASGLVDIHINQTLSETQDTGSGADFLPTILNRSVETSLTLRDGGSVVLGGLISRTRSEGTQGVPLLGKIPILGQLFRTDSDNSATTELLVMVVPYVIRDDADARRVSEQLRDRIRNSELQLSIDNPGRTQQ